jgi:hypothetical protein
MRIVTRGDMDGLTGSVIVARNEQVHSIRLAHPQDITNKRIKIYGDDVLINLPYDPRCGMWFDHHQHTATYSEPPASFKGSYGVAPSAARLVYEYYGGVHSMPDLEVLVRETDRMDAADLTPEDVLSPKGLIKLGFTIDSRTGIGPFENYFFILHDLLRSTTPIVELLEHPEVKKRCDLIAQHDKGFRAALVRHSVVDHNIVVTDFRSLDTIPIGNRFMVYALFPEVNVSVRLHWGPHRQFVVAVIGHSIFNRSCTTDVGALAARLGGGGHRGAGSIPLEVRTAEQTIEEILAELRE